MLPRAISCPGSTVSIRIWKYREWLKYALWRPKSTPRIVTNRSAVSEYQIWCLVRMGGGYGIREIIILEGLMGMIELIDILEMKTKRREMKERWRSVHFYNTKGKYKRKCRHEEKGRFYLYIYFFYQMISTFSSQVTIFKPINIVVSSLSIVLVL